MLMNREEDIIDENIIDGRIQGSNYQDIANDLSAEIGDDLITKTGLVINIYPFRKISGITNFSTKGQGDLSTNPNNLNQFVNIYNGNETQTIVWENSTILKVNENDEIKKEIKVGTYYTTYFDNSGTDNELQSEDINIFGVDYKSEYVDKSISLISYDKEFTMNDQLNYFFIIIDNRVNIPQILQLTSFKNEYHQVTREFLYCELNFETINFKYASTGRNVLEAIQFSAIGEEYAFPKETIQEDGSVIVELDEDKLFKRNGARRIQLDYNSAISQSSIKIMGRLKNEYVSKDENGVYHFNVSKPRRLFLLNPQQQQTNTFFWNSPNSYDVIAPLSRLEKDGIWNTYKEAWTQDNALGNYNVLDEKEVRAGFKFVSDIQNFGGDINNINNIWSEKAYIDMSSFLQSQDFINTLPSLSNVISSGNKEKKTLANFYNTNSFINENVEALTYSAKEIVKWSLPQIHPLLGSIFNIFVGGLDWGWTQDTKINSMYKSFACSIPSLTFIDYQTLFGVADFKQKLMPLDFFDDNKSKNMLPVNTSILSSYSFDLTRFYKDTTTAGKDEIGKGKDGIWDTVYIGQKTFEDGSIINSGFPLKINLNSFSAYQQNDEEYVIDFVETKTIGSCDLKISAFDKENNEIYGLFTKTTSKVKQDLRLWTNRYNFNYYDRINTFGNVKYPELPSIPSPADLIPSYVKIFDTSDLDPIYGNLKWVINNKYTINEQYRKQNEVTLKEDTNEKIFLRNYAEASPQPFHYALQATSELYRLDKKTNQITLYPEGQSVSIQNSFPKVFATDFVANAPSGTVSMDQLDVSINGKIYSCFIKNLGIQEEKVFSFIDTQPSTSCNNSQYAATCLFQESPLIGGIPQIIRFETKANSQDWRAEWNRVTYISIRKTAVDKLYVKIEFQWNTGITSYGNYKNRIKKKSAVSTLGTVYLGHTLNNFSTFFPNANTTTKIDSVYLKIEKQN